MIRAIITLVWADLALERAARERVLTMAFFGFFCAVLFHFTLFLDESVLASVATGGLWAVFFFAATLGAGRSFAAEREHGAGDALLLAPVPSEAVYVGKTLANFLFIFLTQAFVWGAFSLMFPSGFLGKSGTALGMPSMWMAMALGAFGLAALGTLVSAISVHARRREMLFPVLFFPLALPIAMLGAQGWEAALSGGDAAYYLRLLAACVTLYFATGWILFEHVTRE